MKKFFIFLLVLVSVVSTTFLILTYQTLQETEKQLEQLKIPEANSTNQIGIVYLLGSSDVYESLDDAFQKKPELGKLAHGDMLSKVCSMGRLAYIQDRIYGVRYDRVLTQEIPGKSQQIVYQVGELFIVPDTSKT